MSEAHWTSADPESFSYRIASDFVTQIEEKMRSKKLTQKQLAQMLNMSKGYISQILANPGNLTLRTMILFARALGLKVSVVAYDDDDAANVNGPIHSEVFRLCWEKYGKPRDMFDFAESASMAVAFDYDIKQYRIDNTASTDLQTQNVAIRAIDYHDLWERTVTQEIEPCLSQPV